MARPITLFTGQWADLPLEDMCRKASDFGYQGIEVACWGDHFEVNKAVADPNYCGEKRDLLDRYDLQCHAISSHLVGQAVCDRIDQRHKAILPPHVWGDGDQDGVNRRAAEYMKNAARAAQQLGVGVVNGFTGSSIWPYLYSFPPVPDSMLEEGYRQFADRWNPILDVFAECGVRFALEVHPTEIAFDIVTARRALDAIGNREEIIRALNDIKYEGPLSVEWEDTGMDREHGAREACEFVKKLDFEPSGVAFDAAFAET